MSELKRSLWPVVTVVCAIGAFVGGNEVRTRQDLGTAVPPSQSFDVAGIELTGQTVDIPEGEYFYQLTQLLEREYVEPITDERKLAIGAVKGMISGLWDPYSLFYSPEDMVVFQARQKGEFAGAGIEATLAFDEKELVKVRRNAHAADPLMLFPEIRVTMVLPGSPAEGAGLKVGDRLTGINGKALVGFSDIRKVRDAQLAVVKKTMTPQEFGKVRAEFQKKVKSVMGAARAMELLNTGEGRILNLEWSRGGAVMQGTLTTRSMKVPAVQTGPGGVTVLKVFKGVSGELPPVTEATVIDLRQSGMGDASEVVPLLERLAPAANFGNIVKDKGGAPQPLVTTKGGQRAAPIKLLVDESTRGAAEILALALKSKGWATYEGSTAGVPLWVTTTQLEDGSGYTLNTGKFVPEAVEARK
ncbi:MAG: PDZ domain-containing protein [Armatimonadetes bacterium]|nr:PDZ domain-containing protein [Armatimonadota bacterium]